MPNETFFKDRNLPFAECRHSTGSKREYKPHMHSTFSIGAVDSGRVQYKVTGNSSTLTVGSLALVIEPIEEGEVEQVFALFNDEKEAKLEAQIAISESGFTVERSELFNAKWTFESKEELCPGLFDYYDMPYDENIVTQVSDLLGAKMENTPIILSDKMTIQSLRKPI